MSVHKAVAHPETYVDSVLLLAATRAMSVVDGVTWATAVMATPANLEALRAEGITDDALGSSSANDLVLAVTATDAPAADAAITAADQSLFSGRDAPTDRQQAPPRSLAEASERLSGVNVAIVSVPGPFAALEAHKAMGAGMHVLLFSDNVTLDEEIELKQRAVGLGRLVMGPGAGTAVLGGCGLGFANVVSRGRVGVVAAAGTGAQEVMSLLDQWGSGVSQVIGVGGRDLSEAVGGRMAGAAVRALDADPATDVILLVSKPPDLEVARSVIAEATTTPLVAALIGLDAIDGLPTTSVLSSTLEGGVVATMRLLGLPVPELAGALEQAVRASADRLAPERTAVHGLFSGGTLCYESLVLLGKVLGPVYSNIALDRRHKLPAPPGVSICLDLGEQEYTQGRPHPMIDPGARLAILHDAGQEAGAAVVLLDVVLGHGSHPDPAGVLAPVCAEIFHAGGPVVVAYVLGTGADPQGLESQRQKLLDAGCIVAPTGARACLAAAALARRRPELVRALP